jgi:DNA-binding MurR/RpiR family transcriptional regulator
METTMPAATSLQERMQVHTHGLSAAALRVARYFAAHREEVLVASAAELAAKADTSDATVIRTAKALGYAGLDELRRDLADELRRDLTPADRVARTLLEVKGDLPTAFEGTLNLHLDALAALRQSVSSTQFRAVVDHVLQANRVAVFGIGPSSAMASYFVIQVRRFGLDAFAMTDTGLLLADQLLGLRKGDLLLIMAYGRVYPELQALFDCADRNGLNRILMTDTLGSRLKKRTDLLLQIPRGRTDRFSMHTATLAFLESLLVGIAAKRPKETIENLSRLNQLRADVTGNNLDL